MSVAVGYIRVSTDHQASEGISLDAQEAKIRSWAAYQGVVLLSVQADRGISGKSMEGREGLQAAIDLVCSQKGILVVYSLSRMARSTVDALNILDRLIGAGAELVSLTENIDTTSAAGRMFVRMIAVFAEFERETMLERCETARNHLRAIGKPLNGTAPYGYFIDQNGYLKEQPDTIEVVREMIYLRYSQRMSLQGIADHLNDFKVAAPRGGTWSKQTVKVILDYHKAKEGREVNG